MKIAPRHISVFLITIAAASVFVAILFKSVLYAPQDEIIIPETVEVKPLSTTTTTLPSRLIVPALNIDANVQHVGLTEKGNMANPKGFKDVGWYKYGTVPGNLGSAVMAGHLDNGLGLPGVFKHLQDLQPGDDIYTVDSTGGRLHFKVSRIASFNYDEAPTGVFSNVDEAYLNLITCGGAWIPGLKTYDKRIVVYSTYVETIEATTSSAQGI
jgi:sortase (surface protein transpeptidase)